MPRGQRATTTFKNDPTQAPKTNAQLAKYPGPKTSTMKQGLHGFAPPLQFLETAANCHSQNRSLTKIDNSPRHFRRKHQDLVENSPNELLGTLFASSFLGDARTWVRTSAVLGPNRLAPQTYKRSALCDVLAKRVLPSSS